jgi:hypothetical protein
MKIKNKLVIQMTSVEAYAAIKEHQHFALNEAVKSEVEDVPYAKSTININLLQGERTEWFQDFIKRHDPMWIYTPTNNKELENLILSFPHIFGLDEIVHKNNPDYEPFDLYLDGHKLSSEALLNNLLF